MPAPRLQEPPTRPQPCLPEPGSGPGTHYLTYIPSQRLACRSPGGSACLGHLQVLPLACLGQPPPPGSVVQV